jgi:hypothetical protein
MKLVTLIISLPLLVPLAAAAGTTHESCLREEKELRAQEKEHCSGFRYLLDPSGCFSTQRALKEYDSGKCREIGNAEKAPAKQPVTAAPAPAPAPEPVPQPAPAPLAEAAHPAKAEAPPSGPEQEVSSLKAENVRLRAEIERFKAEVERLRK